MRKSKKVNSERIFHCSPDCSTCRLPDENQGYTGIRFPEDRSGKSLEVHKHRFF